MEKMKKSNVLKFEEVELISLTGPGHIHCSFKELTPKKSGLKKSGIGYQEYYKRGYAPPHSHEYMEQIFYFLKGEGVMTLGDEEINVKAGTIVLIPLKTTHSFKNTGKEPLGHFIFEAHL